MVVLLADEPDAVAAWNAAAKDALPGEGGVTFSVPSETKVGVSVATS